jgi:uncharacterized membrane protein YhaH (DUF805 family)
MANEEAVQRIAAYLRAYRGVYEVEALRDQALQQGYTAEDIDEALRRLANETGLTAEPTGSTAPAGDTSGSGRRFWLGVGWAALTAFCLIVAGVIVPFVVGGLTNSLGWALAVSLLLTVATLVLFALIPQRRWRDNPQLRRALLIGYAIAAIPIGLLLLGFGGICLTLIGFA